MARRCLSIILAAGAGTRMRSSLPKVLHTIGGLPLIAHVMRNLREGGSKAQAVVVGPQSGALRREIQLFSADARIYEQKLRLGTAHAVLAAEAFLAEAAKTSAGTACDALIAYGDTPLIKPQTVAEARRRLARGADIIVSGFYADAPAGYGRLLVKAGKLQKIIEEKDASPQEKKINLCNGGFMGLRAEHSLALLRAVNNKNAKGEYYLTDIIAAAAAKGLNIEVMEVPREELIGVNSQAELAQAEALWQSRKRQAVMAAGVSLMAPETVYFSYDTEIAANVRLEPHIYFGCGVKIGENCLIRAFSHIEGAEIGAGAVIGPYARLRPGSRLAENVKIGNFCEIKQTDIAAGVKINHLTYMGDAEIGAGSNIGAGVISCNYDGYNKERITIGAGAFIGSNSALVAPLSIGRGAYIASGSVITKNVADDALAFGRARQEEKPEGGKKLRALFSLKAAEKRQAGTAKAASGHGKSGKRAW